MTFHINSNGFAAPCNANERACPLGAAQHYPSMEAAALSDMVSGLEPQNAPRPTAHRASAHIVPFGKYRDQPVATLLEDRRYCGWLLQQDDFKRTQPSLFKMVRDSFRQDDLRRDFNAIGQRAR